MKRTWLDRAIGYLAPQTGLRRQRARLAGELLQRHYEGASAGRRTQGWTRSISDANSATGPFVGRLRDVARDLVRNNPYAESALATIVDHTVGWGIVAKPLLANARTVAAWKAWSETTACDADAQHDFAGLQKLVMRSIAESGEVLVRRRLRLPEDGLPLPMQLQVLESDYLDSNKIVDKLPNGGRIVYGVELDAIGRRVAYWLYPEHPGNHTASFANSQRIPAENILHIFRQGRPGLLRGASWFGPVLLRFKDFDEFEDATLMKQKIGACLAVITSDVDGTASPLGTADDTMNPGVDSLEPGAILNVPAGRNVEVVQPPSVGEYKDYCSVTLRAIAAGLGVTYEDMTGDYTQLPFSAARMSRIRHWARVDDWRWRLMIPQFCGPVWDWAMQVGQVMGLPTPSGVQWTAPPMPMIEPDKEGLAYLRNIRTGIMSWSEAVRERGYDPDDVLAEVVADNARFDAAGVIFDSDARKVTQAGQLQSAISKNPEDLPVEDQ